MAVKFYKNALVEIVSQGKSGKYIDYLGEQLGFYTINGMERSAVFVLDIIKRCRLAVIPANVCSAIATYYYKKNQNDSALLYTKKTFLLENMTKAKADNAENLAVIFSEIGNKMEAYKYAMIYIHLSDSARKEAEIRDVKNVQNQRTLTVLHEARAFKKDITQRKYILITTFIIVVLALVAVILLILYISSRRKIRLLTDMKRISAKNELLSAEHKTLQDKVVADRKLRAESAYDVSLVRRRLQEIADDPKRKLEIDAWDDIFNAVDKLYPDFRNVLLSYNPKIKNKDLILLYLMKLGFKLADIARIVKSDPSVVWRKFKRIEESLGTSLVVVLRD